MKKNKVTKTAGGVIWNPKTGAKIDGGTIWNPDKNTSPGNPGKPRGVRILRVGKSEKATSEGGIIFNPPLASLATGNDQPWYGRVLNCIPSRKTQDDWQFEHAEAAGLLMAAPRIPDTYDLRETWWGINDQGQTGACVGWAAADGVIRWHMVKQRARPQADLLSPRFLWMSAKETDEFTNYPSTFIELEGTSLKAALDVARKFGNVSDDILPFRNQSLWQRDAEELFALAAQNKIASYYNLGGNVDTWKEWIYRHGPILTRLDVDATWLNAKASNGQLKTYVPPPRPAGHAVAMVGYTRDTIIIRNSWGETDWGDKGFAYASLKYAEAAFTEAYGVAV